MPIPDSFVKLIRFKKLTLRMLLLFRRFLIFRLGFFVGHFEIGSAVENRLEELGQGIVFGQPCIRTLLGRGIVGRNSRIEPS